VNAEQLILLSLNALTGIALLVIVSLGIAVTVGMMGVINLAHGELVMVGAYTVMVLTQQGLPLLLAMLAAPVVAGLVGWVIERLVIRWLYGRVIDTLLATAGISMFMIQVARILFSSDTRSIPMPFGSIPIGEGSIALYRVLMIGLAIILSLFTYLVFTRTRYGLEARAATLNPNMAAAVGINAARTNMWTFVFGSALAGIAGAILAPFTTVTPSMSGLFMARAFMTSITGGSAILLGTATSAAALGIVESIVALITTPVLGQVALLACSVMLLRLFPNGISGSWRRSL
jgi:branched-chain amino acid transport system permease protein